MSNSLSEMMYKKNLDYDTPLYKVTVWLDENSYDNGSMEYSSVQEFDHVADVIFDDLCICIIMSDGCCAYFRTKHVVNWIAEKG